MAPHSRSLIKLTGRVAAAALLALTLTMAVGGYFEHRPFALLRPPAPAAAGAHPRLAVVYWSGDMGMRLGVGEGLVEDLRQRGLSVLTVSSPMLFGVPRDRAYVDRAVATSVRLALARTAADRVIVIGNSFGADVIGAGLGRLPPDLRRRIAQVVLMVPGTSVYFHANPTGVFYRGPVAAEPAHTIPLLRGLAVTCIYGADETASLCRLPVMATARRLPIADGHLMLWHRAELYAAVLRAIASPPRPMT